jgi:hypothetical protein
MQEPSRRVPEYWCIMFYCIRQFHKLLFPSAIDELYIKIASTSFYLLDSLCYKNLHWLSILLDNKLPC